MLAVFSADGALRFDQATGRQMGRAAVDALREQGAADDLLRDWSLLIERCESASYAGSAAEEGDALPERARDCVLRAEGCL